MNRPRFQGLSALTDLEYLDALPENMREFLDDLPTRARKCLVYDRYESIEQIASMGRSWLMRGPNFGRKSLAQVEQALNERGYYFADDDIRTSACRWDIKRIDSHER